MGWDGMGWDGMGWDGTRTGYVQWSGVVFKMMAFFIIVRWLRWAPLNLQFSPAFSS